MDLAVTDFIGIIIYLIIVIITAFLNKKYKKIARGDFIFISIVLLILIELIWLRYEAYL